MEIVLVVLVITELVLVYAEQVIVNTPQHGKDTAMAEPVEVDKLVKEAVHVGETTVQEYVAAFVGLEVTHAATVVAGLRHCPVVLVLMLSCAFKQL
jgi:hypothetical protein